MQNAFNQTEDNNKDLTMAKKIKDNLGYLAIATIDIVTGISISIFVSGEKLT